MKKWIALLLALTMLFSLTACGMLDDDDFDWDYEESDETDRPSGDGQQPGVPADSNAQHTGIAPATITVDQSSGQMQVERPETPGVSMGQEDSWTLFVYVCGADLESENGFATADMNEMAYATASENVRFVVQTGGASDWQNSVVSASAAERYLVGNGDFEQVWSGGAVNMGAEESLKDFLSWGVENYPAEHMGLVFWDHGGGSITGVCFDETNQSDSLSLPEINSALLAAGSAMTDKFELIGFDACLMGTLETANVLASFARYMVGSEETEPGSGWDYEAIGNYLAKEPDASGAQLGKVICDSFYDACAQSNEEDGVTLSVIDLTKIDDLLIRFNSFAEQMYRAADNADTLAGIVRGIKQADNFGGNNRTEGFTNMVDLGGLVDACAANCSEASAVRTAAEAAVVYSRNGAQHPDACGLSLYYPLCVQGSSELTIFGSVCVSPFYASFVDRQDHNSIMDDDAGGDDGEGDDDWEYDEDSGMYYSQDEDGTVWCYDPNEDAYYYYDEDTEEWIEVTDDSDRARTFRSKTDRREYSDESWYDDGQWTYGETRQDASYWSYADDFEPTGESRYITFASEAALDADGVFSLTLDENGRSNAAAVYGYVFEQLEGSDELLLLGETYDVIGDYGTGRFEDCFDGFWLSLPDGQNLMTYIVDYSDDFVLYTAPIYCNGERTNLRIKQTLSDGEITVEGLWDGVDENGASGRGRKTLQDGDKIIPIYFSYSLDNEDAETEWNGEVFTVQGSVELGYGWLEDGTYYFSFLIDDLYGDFYMTEFTAFAVENEAVYFFEE